MTKNKRQFENDQSKKNQKAYPIIKKYKHFFSVNIRLTKTP